MFRRQPAIFSQAIEDECAIAKVLRQLKQQLSHGARAQRVKMFDRALEPKAFKVVHESVSEKRSRPKLEEAGKIWQGADADCILNPYSPPACAPSTVRWCLCSDVVAIGSEGGGRQASHVRFQALHHDQRANPCFHCLYLSIGQTPVQLRA